MVRFVLKQLILVCLLLMLSATSFAVSLEEYRKDLEATKIDLGGLRTMLGKKDESGPSTEDVKRVFTKIESRFDGKYEVDAGQTTVEVDLYFLNSARRRLIASAVSSDKKLEVVDSTIGRLESLINEVKLLQSAKGAGLSKAEQKEKLENILNDEKYKTANGGEQSLAQRFLNWLDRILKSLFKDANRTSTPKPGDMSLVRGALQIVVLAVAVVLILFLVIRFGPGLLRRFTGRKRLKRKQLILGEEIPEDVDSKDLLDDAEQLALKGDLRGAIRKGYIALLFELGERRELKIARHKTNRDYLRDVRKNNELFPGMTELTRAFEKHWYGLKETGQDDWSAFKAAYEKTLGESR